MPTKTPTKIKFNKDSRIKKITTMDQNGNTTTSRMKYDKDGNLVKSVTKKHGDEIDAKGNVVDTKSRVVKKYDKDGTEVSTKTTGNTTTKADTASDVNNTPAQNTTDATNTNTGNQIDDPDKPYPVKPEKAENTPVESKPVENKPTETTKEPVEKPDAPAEEAPKGDNPEGLGWFAKNWKTIAIAAGSAAVLIAIFKKMSEKSIKVRFKKCTNVLSRMQKDFTLSKNGLDMNAVLPGIGLRIMDKIAKVFTRVLKGKDAAGAEKGAIGLHPFCQTYKDEIKKDFELAQNAYNQISAAGDKSITSPKTESSQIVYSSFREALSSGVVNEESKPINEMALGTAISLGALALRGGMFVLSKLKNGKAAQGEDKAVQVTKESTREICYAIMNNFISKYINMEGLMQKMGINATSLSDLDASSVDKLKTVLEKYGSVTEQSATKQYARLKSMYDNMLKHYYHIGDGLIQNFEKYTKDANKDEKHANLMLAAKEKLQAMWDRQKDIYNNNFSHVIVEIIKSDEYISYLNFIIEKVLPVFKSGLAGDADYVLDVMPKKDEYYVVRQTEGKDQLTNGQSAGGNMVLVKINSFDKDAKKISFSRIGIIKSEVEYNDDGSVTIVDTSQIDTKAYGNNKEQKVDGLEYGKWLSLDPHITNYNSGNTSVHSDVYQRKDAKTDMYIMAIDTKGKHQQNGVWTYDTILMYTKMINGKPHNAGMAFALAQSIDDDDFKKFAEGRNSDPKLDMNFTKVNATQDDIDNLRKQNKNPESVNDIADIAEKVNDMMNSSANGQTNHTKIYFRTDASVQETYVIGLGDSSAFDKIAVYVNKHQGCLFKLPNPIDEQTFVTFVTSTNSNKDLNMGFSESKNQSDSAVSSLMNAVGNNHNSVNGTDDIAKYINGEVQKALANAKNNRLYTSDELVRNAGGIAKTISDAIAKSGSAAVKNVLTLNIKTVTSGKSVGVEYDASNNQVSLRLIVDNNYLKLPNSSTVYQVISGVKKDEIENKIKNELSVAYKNAIDNNQIVDSVEYTSVMNEKGCEVTRNINGVKEHYDYIVSESVWGDGTHANVNADLNTGIKTVRSFKTFESLSKYAKSNPSVKLMRYSDNASYVVPGPKNGIGVLTEANPLYESLVLISVDDDKITNIGNAGIYKITEQDPND